MHLSVYLIIIVLLLLGLLIYKYAFKPFSYWKERNVLYSKDLIPMFGNTWKSTFKKISMFDNFIELYEEYPNESYNGIYNFNMSSLLVRDLETLKQICVKDFDYFTDHRHQVVSGLEELFFKNLVQLNGDEWKHMRATLSPAFTGSKMKGMFVMISECAKQFAENFVDHRDEVAEIDMKDLFSRFTNDVIASCAFGVQCDSIKDRENDFYMMGKDAMQFEGFRLYKFFLFAVFPKLFQFFKCRVFPKTTSDFFMNIIQETFEYRSANGVVRPDMLHLLMEAKKGKLKHEDNQDDKVDKGFAVIEESSIGKREIVQKEITNEDIAAQAFIFFFAGFETASVILSMMANELAINVDVQEKLQKEIDDVMEEHNGKPTYEAVMGMKYMDMVVSEVLRKWPAAPVTDRECTKEYTLKGKGTSYTLQKGENITIPIIGLQRDPRYFPNPDKFDPERFLDENKKNIIPYTYIPFGVGPRACIGSRFALMEIKLMFVHLLSKFDLVVTKKTAVPITLSRKTIRVQPEGGYWVGMKKRQQ
ncbi:PREDICTED: cytochrome P450 9e2-like isoform X2 [Nicrophorus vespilloides]|uniref:Cytochrome P450 9e2-like isoform X2 n=1 Tax=Nicrophorus vespilloides TaxID=110193 RepID=A0ABM1MRX4_NICVS|nr:PREDICTED: cytochrome P450 9e2-like isoform X2 [Nicrophorus vespilloides]